MAYAKKIILTDFAELVPLFDAAEFAGYGEPTILLCVSSAVNLLVSEPQTPLPPPVMLTL